MVVGACFPLRLMITRSPLNSLSREEFVGTVGPVFEHSPWIAGAAWLKGPFANIDEPHLALCKTIIGAGEDKQLSLTRAHPDLVGRAVPAGTLGAASTGEQAAAGLGRSSPVEIELIQKNNSACQSQFGLPFVICARLNKKEAVPADFKRHLRNPRETEIKTALEEIFKLAELRLRDLTPNSLCPPN